MYPFFIDVLHSLNIGELLHSLFKQQHRARSPDRMQGNAI
jgi:hypothetical protein